MNAAENGKRPGNRKRDVRHAARRLISGVEREYFRIDIGVMLQIRVVIDDSNGFAGRYT